VSSRSIMSLQRVLSIQSYVSSGFVGNRVAFTVFNFLGIECDTVNTVSFSNHACYPCVRGSRLSADEFLSLIDGLEQNSLANYSHILTGYCGTPDLLRAVPGVIQKLKAKNPNIIYVCDPVLGDNGQFYVPEGMVPIYREFVLPHADILTPNEHELRWLTESPTPITTPEQAIHACALLHAKGIPLIILKSLFVASRPGSLLLLSSEWDKATGKQRILQCWFPRIEGMFYGTGDAFSALWIGHFCCGKAPVRGNLTLSIQKVISTMQAILLRTKESGLSELRLVQAKDVIEHPPNDVEFQVTERSLE